MRNDGGSLRVCLSYCRENVCGILVDNRKTNRYETRSFFFLHINNVQVSTLFFQHIGMSCEKRIPIEFHFQLLKVENIFEPLRPFI